MASTSVQGLELNKNDGGWEAETSDDSEIIKDEIFDNLDSCSGGDDEMLQLPIEIGPVDAEPLEPYIGMEFESSEDAREFYDMYSIRMGFTIRNTRIRRSHKDNSIIGREFVCSREGFRAKKHLNRENRVLPPRPITREGCNAMLRVAVKNGRKWVVSGFVREHNHDLNPSKLPPRRFHRSIFSEDEKDQKIRELSIELHRERRRCASYQEQLRLILKDIEEHTQNLSLKVENIVNNVRELESEDQNCSDDRLRWGE
ncbi:FAR1 DNA binding domain [Macleaya cordata]|uniref:FAR1 DNA binding domain n=1 Tax=Macleaya cordata TaxID=56857 RepID=A0A200QKR3_MACCD|nr:FAR1 DNA binding domain [Macleaya cordata]